MALCTVEPVQEWFIPSTAIDKGTSEKVDRLESMAPCARGFTMCRHGEMLIEVGSAVIQAAAQQCEQKGMVWHQEHQQPWRSDSIDSRATAAHAAGVGSNRVS